MSNGPATITLHHAHRRATRERNAAETAGPDLDVAMGRGDSHPVLEGIPHIGRFCVSTDEEHPGPAGERELVGRALRVRPRHEDDVDPVAIHHQHHGRVSSRDVAATCGDHGDPVTEW